MEKVDAERIEIGEIAAFSGDAEIKHKFSGSEPQLRVGGKIYAGDTLNSNSGMLEVTFGLNIRLALKDNSSVRIKNNRSSSKIIDGIMHSMTTYTFALIKGSTRCRVRQNLVTTSVVELLGSPHYKLTLPRSDVILTRKNPANRSSDITTVISWGKMIINHKNISDTEWNVEDNIEVNSPSEIVIPEEPKDSKIIVEPVKISLEKATQDTSSIPFSADTLPDSPVEETELDPALHGA